MKTHTAYFELIIIMAFIVTGVPLLLQLMITCNNSKMNYMEDKTMYKLTNSVEYVRDPVTNQLQPLNLAPISMDCGSVEVIPFIQDKYCPKEARVIDLQLTAVRPNGTDSSGAEVGVLHNAASESSLTITDGWLAKRVDETSSFNHLVDSKLKAAMSPYYIVWNTKTNHWMITHEFINIFEE